MEHVCRKETLKYFCMSRRMKRVHYECRVWFKSLREKELVLLGIVVVVMNRVGHQFSRVGCCSFLAAESIGVGHHKSPPKLFDQGVVIEPHQH